MSQLNPRMQWQNFLSSRVKGLSYYKSSLFFQTFHMHLKMTPTENKVLHSLSMLFLSFFHRSHFEPQVPNFWITLHKFSQSYLSALPNFDFSKGANWSFRDRNLGLFFHKGHIWGSLLVSLNHYKIIQLGKKNYQVKW